MTRISERVLLFVDDEFGREVAKFIQRLFRHCETIEVSDLQKSALPEMEPSTVALITWRPMPHVAELLDEYSARTKIPFLSISAQDGVISVGPMVTPGYGSCWRCTYLTGLQSGPSASILRSRMDFYAANPTQRPEGHLTSLAYLTAAKALEKIERRKTHNTVTTTTISIATLHFATLSPRGLSACDRCSQPQKRRPFINEIGDL